LCPLSPIILIASLSLADRPPDPATLPLAPEHLRPGMGAVDEEELRFWVSFLASDELEGRDTAKRGYDVAARFCALVLERHGAKPAGDNGTFFQDFEAVRSEPDAGASWIEVKDAAGAERFGLEEMSLAFDGDLDWKVPWTFIGRGEAAEGAPSPFQGIPLADRAVLVLPRPGKKEHEARPAIEAGAKRVVVISEDRVKSRMGLFPHEWPAFGPHRPYRPPFEVVYITRKVADRILRHRDLSVEKLLALGDGMSRFDIDGVEMKVAVKRRETKLRVRNVVGLVEGSDPARRGEAVAVGAHLDHIGTRGADIFHGADDDASGSAGVLALARALAESPRRPARSVLLLLFAGEERGFWGSRWFVEHSPIPIAGIKAQIQLDMIGRNAERRGRVKAEDNANTVNVVGARRRSLDIDRTIVDGNRFLGLDLRRSEGIFGGSDHVLFDERKIPVAFFFTGDHPDYHRASDTADRINYPKMARIVRLAFIATFELADRAAPLAPARRI
jgi:hypothetical protein